MARVCDSCGKKTRIGRHYARRGLERRKGGAGRKITGHTARTFKPNLQNIRIVVGNHVTRTRMCTQCLRTGNYVKPGPKRGRPAPD